MYDITNFDWAHTVFCAILLQLLEAAMCWHECTVEEVTCKAIPPKNPLHLTQRSHVTSATDIVAWLIGIAECLSLRITALCHWSVMADHIHGTLVRLLVTSCRLQSPQEQHD